ncbi:hypothetical protein ABEP50_29495 [Priestia megaterium]
MTERKPIVLDIHDIVKDNHLLADFLMRDDLRERLKNGTYDDFKVLIKHFKNQKNVKSFASIFKSGKYAEYVEDKTKDLTLEIVKDFATELTLDALSVNFVLTLRRALKQLASTHGDEQAVNEFIAELEQYKSISVMDVLVGDPPTNEESEQAGRIDVACKLIEQQAVTIEAIQATRLYTEDDIKIIKAATNTK